MYPLLIHSKALSPPQHRNPAVPIPAMTNCQLVSVHVFSGTEDSPEPVPDIAGTPKHCYQNMVILPFNNTEASVSLVRKHAKELACVIMDSVVGMELAGILAEKPFMEAIRRVTEEEGILLIWDEVVTGFRCGLGGIEGHYGVVPDLRAFGKTLGGGFPIGAFVGKKEIMDKAITPTGTPLDRKEKVFQSVTFSGNEITAVAGLAMINELERQNPYPYMNRLGEQLRSGWKKIADGLGVKVQVTGIFLISAIKFADQPIRSLRDVIRVDAAKAQAFRMGLFANGIIFSGRGQFNMSAAHSEEDINKVLEVSEYVLREIKTAGD